jgi:glyoxylase-like metal-dependent hydrolase (beta-lactamase superfamily II)
MKRTLLITAFAGLLASGVFVTQSDAKPDTVKEIVKGVWFREGDLKGKGHCNNIIVEMKDYLVVIDANFPNGAQAALADIRKLSSKPVRYVFDTHHHGDHAYGNPIWSKAGATTLAHKGVLDELKRYEPKRWQEAAKERPDVRNLKLSTTEAPKQTFSDKPFVLDDGARRIEFHHFGWAHTRGDGFAFLPKEGILCTGDAATNGPYNFTGDANIANWPTVIGRASALNPRHVLPGHGPAGGGEILSGEMEFMLQLRNNVNRAIQQGRTLNELVTFKDKQPIATTIRVPDSVKNWVGPSFAAQVRDAFEEITTGKPHGDLPH